MPLLNSSNRVIPRWRSEKQSRFMLTPSPYIIYIKLVFSGKSGSAEWLDYLCLYFGADCELLTKAPRREEIEEVPYRQTVYAGQGRGAANRYWLDVLSSSSDFARQDGRGWRGGRGKFRKPLAAKRIFLPVLVESSWKKKKDFRSKVFRRLVRVFRRASREAALKGETVAFPDRHQRLFGFSQFLRIHTTLKCAVCFVTNGAQSALRYSVKYNCLTYESRKFNSRQIRKFKIVKISHMNCRVAVLSPIASSSLGQAESSNVSLVDVFKIVTSLKFLTSNFLRLM